MGKLSKNGIESTRITRSRLSTRPAICLSNERKVYLKKVLAILKKPEKNRTEEDEDLLATKSEIVNEIQQKMNKKEEAKRRLIETEDPIEVLHVKCRQLAEVLLKAKHLVVYTGAGISTAAKIPDYRGPNGIWTRLQQGKDIEQYDISAAEPTFTHMALWKLYEQNILRHIVSQNCDGLHLRSGIPKTSISELHGNMYVEVCNNCKPSRQYWRLFDVTENTARYSHKTMRSCYHCNESLIDSIVHFGERGTMQWPLNWSGACKQAEMADVIVCLGSSLKVMKRYPWLWQMGKPAKKRPAVFIVNLQWTPKDDSCVLKINGKCDQVMQLIMTYLKMTVPFYQKQHDPIFYHFTDLHPLEMHTTSQPCLQIDANDRIIFEDDDLTMASTKSEPQTSLIVSNPDGDPNINELFMQYFYINMLYQNLYLMSPWHRFAITAPTVLTRISEQSQQHVQPHPVPKKSCNFCYQKYKTSQCQFYNRNTTLFEKGAKKRFSKSQQKVLEIVCQCCDYSTDEDDNEFGDDDECPAQNDGAKKLCNGAAAVVQAGWFGKGCRKNRKTRRKQFSKFKTD